MAGSVFYTLQGLCALPFCLWIIWSDLAALRIPNLACAGIAAGFLLPALASGSPMLTGGVVQAVAVLLGGLALFGAGVIGAGDAKLAAVAAAHIDPEQHGLVLGILAAAMPAALLTHRAVRASALITLAPGWKSWSSRGFPFGFVLAPSLLIYLALTPAGP